MRHLTKHNLILTLTNLGVCILVYALYTHTAYGAETFTYKPFVNIPGFNYESADLPGLVNRIYITVVALGATLGVLRIAFAGVKYTTSDVVTSKQSALSDINGVFLGLGVLLIPAIVLGTINANLLNLNVFENFGKALGVVRLQNEAPSSGLNAARSGSVESIELRESCPNDLVATTQGVCCGDASYGGPYVCSAETERVILDSGIDASKVYDSLPQIRRMLEEDYRYTEVPWTDGQTGADATCYRRDTSSTPVIFRYKDDVIDMTGTQSVALTERVSAKLFCIKQK